MDFSSRINRRTGTLVRYSRKLYTHFRRGSLRPGARIPAINTIQEAADEPSENLHVKVERTMTYQDPDFLDERDV